jgi:hypothetical protein
MTINRSDENWQWRNYALENACGEAYINLFLNFQNILNLRKALNQIQRILKHTRIIWIIFYVRNISKINNKLCKQEVLRKIENQNI